MHHRILEEQFEQYLAGEPSPELTEHLRVCQPCREEARAMAEVAGLFRDTFQTPSSVDVPEPSPRFYVNIQARIAEAEQSWVTRLFPQGVVFFRRIAFASLVFAAALGTLLVSRETSLGAVDMATIMAQHTESSSQPDSASQPDSVERDRLLVTLVGYSE